MAHFVRACFFSSRTLFVTVDVDSATVIRREEPQGCRLRSAVPQAEGTVVNDAAPLQPRLCFSFLQLSNTGGTRVKRLESLDASLRGTFGHVLV